MRPQRARLTIIICLVIVLATGLIWWRSVRETDQIFVDLWRISSGVWSHCGYLSAFIAVNKYDVPRYQVEFRRESSDTVSSSGLVWYEYTAHWDFELYSEPSGYRVIEATVPLWFVGIAVTFPVLFISWRKRKVAPGKCRCGYDLRGSRESMRCPECGMAIPKAV